MTTQPPTNPFPVYDLLYRADKDVYSNRIHFKDQGQADEAVRTIRTAGSAIRTSINTRYGAAVVDLTPGVFLGMYPHFNNAPVDQSTFRASDAPPSPTDSSIMNRDTNDDVPIK